ncbi:MAG: LytTR family DNA-binding domain-containing protein [Acholeplasmataceae bacterium]|nr:LytTR family DNA-binding domain-containing protein [Acholeplasmataceae bacterium]
MKIIVNKHQSFGEPIITIDCDEEDSNINELIQKMNQNTSLLIGNKGDQQFLFKEKDVYYIESIDSHCFLYTKTDVFDCRYKLYEIAEQFPSLIRVNKQVCLNYHHIKVFKSTLNSKLEATLNNGDRIEISRAFVPALKNVLGGMK